MRQGSTGKVSDRRGFQRKALETKVKYIVLMPYCALGSTKNISEGGLCLLLDRELKKGFVLRVEFDTNDGKLNQLVKVMWQRKEGNRFLTGVKFLT